MKNKIKLFNIITLVLITSFITAGCPKDGDPENGNPDVNETIVNTLTGTVTISGTAKVLETLTANTGNLGGTEGTIAYQWKRGDTASGTFTNISGATSSTYTLTMADLTKYIKVTVTRTGYNGSVTNTTAAGPIQQATDPTKALTSVADASSFITEGSRTDVMKIDTSKLNGSFAVAQYSLAAYKNKEIKITLSVDVKREGAAGNLLWQINNNPGYPIVVSQNNVAAGTWITMSNNSTPVTVTPTDANPVLYLNNDNTAGTTNYYIDNFTITITITDPFIGGETLNTLSSEQVTRKLFGYDYELWNQDKQETAIMQVPAATNSANGGIFKCNWNKINNVLFRAGRKYPTTGSAAKTHSEIGTFSIDYEAPVFNLPGGSGKSNAYLSVYGWVTGGTPDALIEYYIIESLGEYNPGSTTTQVGPTAGVSIDGGTYKLYKVQRTNAPSIEGNKNFVQYFSIRTTTRTSGTISVSEHFKAWANNGMTSIDNGKLYEVSLKVESYGGTAGNAIGNAEITKNILKVNNVPIQ